MEIRSLTSVFGDKSINTNQEAIATLYSCIRLITNTISATQLKHLNIDQEEITESSTTKTLRSPAENVTYFNWMNNMTRDLILHGNSYTKIQNSELIYIPHNRVQIYITHKEEAPFYYHITHFGKVEKLFPEQMIHFKNVSEDGILGISPLQLHKSTFDAASSMVEYTKNFVDNSSGISGFISTTKKMSKQSILELVKTFKAKFTGIKNAGNVPVLPEGMTFTSVSRASAADIDFINNYKLNKSLIAEIFQVPLSMLGTTDLAYTNAEANALMYQNYTINPIMRNIEQELSLKLLTNTKENIKFLVDSLQLSSTKEKADSLSLLVNTQIFTPNEARKKYGFTSINGGDEFKQKDNLVGDAVKAPKNTDITNSLANIDKPPSKA